LRAIVKENPPPTSEWVRRSDLFGQAADWLLEAFQEAPRAELYCEAGLSKVGDRSLNDLPHIVHRERPLLHVKIASADPQLLVKMLRRGRSPWRFLGAVASKGSADRASSVSTSAMLFICDAFEVDSLIVVSLDD
jgi:hypothetical protein